jgi:hypothetical protein
LDAILAVRGTGTRRIAEARLGAMGAGLVSGNNLRCTLRRFGKRFPDGPISRLVSSSLPLSGSPSASLRMAGSSERSTCLIAGFSQEGEAGSSVAERRSMEISDWEARCIVDRGLRRVVVALAVEGRREGWL